MDIIQNQSSVKTCEKYKIYKKDKIHTIHKDKKDRIHIKEIAKMLSLACCPVCRESVLTGQICTTECGHLCHFDCFFNWIKIGSSCPQCGSQNPSVTKVFADFTAENRIINEHVEQMAQTGQMVHEEENPESNDASNNSDSDDESEQDGEVEEFEVIERIEVGRAISGDRQRLRRIRRIKIIETYDIYAIDPIDPIDGIDERNPEDPQH